eukprot:Gregarina_sp_Pseudo_9__2732@NODE_2974_length_797_cov_6_923483_g2715_i0_p2_GENE_NODE_2974_length_797_cov_6_923483_g2715_i0NODE_2974_length_797_cov_6_923483_g2715_i0_p2_ORF_typecomplete_len229_score99_19_NODE_2974_length_797_cov_6_923483_g2715_i038724
MDESTCWSAAAGSSASVRDILCCGRAAVRQVDDHEVSLNHLAEKRGDGCWRLTNNRHPLETPSPPPQFDGVSASPPARDGWSCLLDPAPGVSASPTSLSFLESPLNCVAVDNHVLLSPASPSPLLSPASPSPLPVVTRGALRAPSPHRPLSPSPRRWRWWRSHPSLFVSVSSSVGVSRCSAAGERWSYDSLMPFFDSVDETPANHTQNKQTRKFISYQEASLSAGGGT